MSRKVMFRGVDSAGNVALWETDGTSTGTIEVGGPGNSGISGASKTGLNPDHPTALNGKALFTGFDRSGFEGLWVTDGITATEIGGVGSMGISGANQQPNGLDPLAFSQSFNGKVLFTGFDQDGFQSLWVTDGTLAGTNEIGGLGNTGINGAGAHGLSSFAFGVLNGAVLLTGGNGALWLSDGTAAGTRQITGISGASTNGLNATFSAQRLNGKLFLSGNDAINDNGLWITDGTAAGTVEIGGLGDHGVAGVFPGVPGSPPGGVAIPGGLHPSNFVLLGNEMLFTGYDSSAIAVSGVAIGLWVSDGTATGTHEITGTSGLDPDGMVALNGKVLFRGNAGLWVTDGTSAGTHELTNIAGALNGGSGINPVQPTVSNGIALFQGLDAAGNKGLWVTDGTAAGTHELTVNGANSNGLNPFNLLNLSRSITLDDFTGSGTSDIAWFNGTSGDVDEWQISNGKWAASVGIGSHPGSGWQIAGIQDFNGDGTSDVLWFNPGSGQTDIWELSSGKWSASVSPGTHPTGYQVAGVADFTGSGTSDILWLNPTTGDVDEWLINNAKWAGSVDIGSHPGGGWQIGGVGDFNGDGTSDVFWYNQASGQSDVWELLNGKWSASVSPGNHPTGYEMAGIGDFNGDGTSDALFFNPTTGDVDEWLINNGRWAGSVDLGSHPGSGWQISGVGDYNGDGTSDVLWSNPSTGGSDIWLLANGKWAASVSPGNHPTGYQVAFPNS
jgi:ELWxxDGT repeat protein